MTDKAAAEKVQVSGRRVLEIESKAVTRLIGRIGQGFVDAVEMCAGTDGHIVVMGMGKSGLIGKKIAATLASTGSPAFFLHPAEGIHGDVGMVSRKDVVLIISNSGETEEVLRILPSIKRWGLKTIVLTGCVNSTLAKMGDVVLDVSVEEEACSLGLAPTASTTATLAMGDALAVALLEKKGFQKEDFATFHPGGTLGRTLLLRVESVMRRGSEIPIVHDTTPMQNALVEMTRKRLGMTAVVDAEGRLCGILTDGDLRRWLKAEEVSGQGRLSQPVCEVMTRSPKTITKEVLATEAIARMEQHGITVFIVESAGHGGRVEGVVHMHDLLKSGIA